MDFDEILWRGGAWPREESDFGGNPDSFLDLAHFPGFYH